MNKDELKSVYKVKHLIALCEDLDPDMPVLFQAVGQEKHSPVWSLHGEAAVIWPQNPNLYIRLSHPELKRLSLDGDISQESEANILRRVADRLDNS